MSLFGAIEIGGTQTHTARGLSARQMAEAVRLGDALEDDAGLLGVLTLARISEEDPP